MVIRVDKTTNISATTQIQDEKNKANTSKSLNLDKINNLDAKTVDSLTESVANIPTVELADDQLMQMKISNSLGDIVDSLYNITNVTKGELDNYDQIINYFDDKTNELESFNMVIENYVSKLEDAKISTKSLISSIKTYVDNNNITNRTDSTYLDRAYTFYQTILSQLNSVLGTIDWMQIVKLNLTQYNEEVQFIKDQSGKLEVALEQLALSKRQLLNVSSAEETLNTLIDNIETSISSGKPKSKDKVVNPNMVLLTNDEVTAYLQNTDDIYIYSNTDAKYMKLYPIEIKSVGMNLDLAILSRTPVYIYNDKFEKLTRSKVNDYRNTLSEIGYIDDKLFIKSSIYGFIELCSANRADRTTTLNDISKYEPYKELTFKNINSMDSDLNTALSELDAKIAADSANVTNDSSANAQTSRINNFLQSLLSSSEIETYNDDKISFLSETAKSMIDDSIIDCSEYDIISLSTQYGGVNSTILNTSLVSILSDKLKVYYNGLSLSDKELFINEYFGESINKDVMILNEVKTVYIDTLNAFINLKKIPDTFTTYIDKYLFIKDFAAYESVDYQSNGIEYYDVLSDRVLATNPNSGTNAKLKFLKIPYNTVDIDTYIVNASDTSFVDFDSFVSNDPLWSTNMQDIVNTEFNYINTHLYSIDTVLKNARAFSNFAYMYNYLKNLDINANYNDVLRFTEDEINGSGFIYLKDALITMSVMVNRIFGITYDKIMDDSDLLYIYELNNKSEASEIEKSTNDDGNDLYLFIRTSADKRKIFGDIRNIYINDVLNLSIPPSPGFSSTEYTVVDKVFDIDDVNDSYIVIDKDLTVFSRPVRVKRMKFKIIDSLGRESFINRIGLITKDVTDYYNLHGDYNLSLSYVESRFLEHVKHKQCIEDLLNNTESQLTYYQLYSYYKTMAFSKYSNSIFDNLENYDTYLEYLQSKGYVDLINWIACDDVPGFALLTFSEKREIYRQKLLRLTNTILNYVNSTEFAKYFTNHNYLYYVKKMIKTVIDVFKSYTVRTLSGKTELIIDNYFDNHIKLLDDYKITGTRHVGESIYLYDDYLINTYNKLVLPDYSTPPNAVVIGGDFVVNNGDFVVNNS